ncbi:MAG: CPBP family intramembrane glutamic endopeptidase [Flavitalea sp.]
MRALLLFAMFLLVYLSGNIILQRASLEYSPVILNTILFSSTTFLLVFLFRKYADEKSIVSLGFPFSARNAIMGSWSAIVVLGLVITIFKITSVSSFDHFSWPGINWYAGLLIMLVVGISEETLFRGYLLNNLMQSFDKWRALGFSAMMFAFMHIGNPNITAIAALNILLAGGVLGCNYIFTKNLWFGILFHFTWNFLLGPVLGYNVSGVGISSLMAPELRGSEVFTGGAFGPEGSVIVTVLLSALLVVIPMLYRPRN